MRIPEATINEIRNATDIIEYIGMFVKLRKRGKNYIGLCPFHSEKTPSFNVSADKGMYYCFGCHRGGDVIKFVMEWEKASYVEAIEILAERAGIVIQRTDDGFQPASETEKLFSVCSLAARFFYRSLNSEEGKFALDYFRSRGFSDKTITTFGLGYSPRGWEALLQHAEQEGVKPETLEKVGLIRRREDGTPYDTFRGRAMFPVFSSSGRVIAFGARKLYEDDPLGKYINSPETSIYQKSKVLYGLFQAKEAIREHDSVVLVEGYADLISVYQSGIRNVVASSGTALTTEQIQLIARYTKNIALVYDADVAGTAAMMRGVDLILEGGLDVRIIQLPEGEDPDSFIRKNGGEAFEELLKKAVTFVDFKANIYYQQGMFDSPEGKADAVRGLVQSIAKINDPLRQAEFISEVAQRYKIYQSVLQNELEKFNRRVPERFVKPAEHAVERQHSIGANENETDELPVDEREIFSSIFEDPNAIIPFVFKYLQPGEFTHRFSKRLSALLLDIFNERGTIEVNTLMNVVDDERLKMIIANIAFNRYELSEKWNNIGARLEETRLFEIAFGAIKSIKRKNLERELESIRKEMNSAALRGEDAVPFLKLQQESLKKLKELDSLKLVTQ